MRTSLSLLVVGLLLVQSGLVSSSKYRKLVIEDTLEKSPAPFKAGNEYIFEYNGQVSSGLVESIGQGEYRDQDLYKSENDMEMEKTQIAITRLQAFAYIQFLSDERASLQLSEIRVGQLNGRSAADPKRVQPMGMFEAKPISNEYRVALEQPLEFEYKEGVVKRVYFHTEDALASKNLKRAVLNLIQLNFESQNAIMSTSSEKSNSKTGSAYIIPETSIEGECLTAYTINAYPTTSYPIDLQSQSKYERFNVTKSIDFKRCRAIADVAYGFDQSQDEQSQKCALKARLSSRAFPEIEDESCDPKEVNEDTLQRSTVQRIECFGSLGEKMCAIKRAEALSHYVLKNGFESMQSSESSTTSMLSLMHTIAVSELLYRGRRSAQQETAKRVSDARVSSLIYDNEWDVEKKGFYMRGDTVPNPFKSVTLKAPPVSEAQKIYHHLIESTVDKSKGIEGETAAQLQRLVQILRMCSMEELQSVQRDAIQGLKPFDVNRMEQLLADTLAMAGTYNAVYVLVHKINNAQISPIQAAKTLKNLNRIPAASDEITSQISHLCKSELARRNAPLYQSCWLTFGAMVGQMCRAKMSVGARQQEQEGRQRMLNKDEESTVFGTQTGFYNNNYYKNINKQMNNKNVVCSMEKKRAYKQILLRLYQEAETIYEKVLALKAIGNAGLDNCVDDLEKIIASSTSTVLSSKTSISSTSSLQNVSSSMVRAVAIDALRRMRVQMPYTIQRICLPIFENTKELAQLRMTAFSMLMSTQPQRPILDQVLYTLAKERSPQVQSLVYSTIRTLVNSPIHSDRDVAKQLKSALELSGVDEEEVKRASMRMHLPIIADEGISQADGMLLTLTSIFGENEMLPAYFATGIRSIFNGKQNIEGLKLSMSQQGMDLWLEKAVDAIVKAGNIQISGSQTRAGRTNMTSAERELRNIFSQLGIKARKTPEKDYSSSSSLSANEETFAMLCLRFSDIDQAILPMDGRSMPHEVKQALQQGSFEPIRALVRQMFKFVESQKFHSLSAATFNEKRASVPTSAGLPLKIAQSTPFFSCIEAEANVESKTLDPFAPKVGVKAHAIMTGVHMQKMESWTPFGMTGVESMRALELNAPFNFEIQMEKTEVEQTIGDVKLTLILPESKRKTRLFGIHTLAFTFTDNNEMDTPKLRVIDNPNYGTEVNTVVGERSLGLPIRISGNVHMPSRLMDLSAWVQLAMTTENHMHVTFEPNVETPHALVFRASGSLFRPQSSSAEVVNALKKLGNFYEQADQESLKPPFPEYKNESMQVKDMQKRNQNLRNFVQKMSTNFAQSPEEHKGQYAVYKHAFRLTFHTQGDKFNANGYLNLHAVCDARFHLCTMATEIKRTPIYAQESSYWTFNSEAQLLMPETVSSPVEFLRLRGQKQQKFLVKMESTWGTSRQQFLNIYFQGENVISNISTDQEQRQQLNSVQEAKEQTKRAFINKFDAVAFYKLSPDMLNLWSRLFDALKARNFWTTEMRAEQIGEEGKMYAGLFIHPTSARKATIQVRLPTQAVRISSIQLPYSIRLMPLIRATDKSTHCVAQMLANYVRRAKRSECAVSGSTVETFDGMRYKGPITSSCYSVLAKDCSNNNQPQFAVLMKNLDKDGKQKKIKIIFVDQIIECQAKDNTETDLSGASIKKIACEINGKPVRGRGSRVPSWGKSSSSSEEHPFKSSQLEPVVECDNEECTSVTIVASSGVIAVRFVGHKAWIQLSSEQKNMQCGLCGHYDDDSTNELRMGNNQATEDLIAFHRSYLITSELCTEHSLDKFYTKSKNKFALLSKKTKTINADGVLSDETTDFNNEDDVSSDLFSSESHFFEGFAPEGYSDEIVGRHSSNKMVMEPELKTKVIEHNHQMCFSAQLVKQCPVGSTPASSGEQSAWDSEDHYLSTKIKFVCMPRYEARQYLNAVMRAPTSPLDFAGRQPNFADFVEQPKMCRRF